jgi:hypothetical protein
VEVQTSRAVVVVFLYMFQLFGTDIYVPFIDLQSKKLSLAHIPMRFRHFCASKYACRTRSAPRRTSL